MMITNALNVLKCDKIACCIQFWNRLASPISMNEIILKLTPRIHHGGVWNIFGANFEKTQNCGALS